MSLKNRIQNVYKALTSKAMMSSTVDSEMNQYKKQDGRGSSVYTASQLIQVSARNKQGKTEQANIQLDFSQTDALTCLMIGQKCTPVFGIVTGWANEVSTRDFVILPKKKIEDKIVFELRQAKEIYDEYDNVNSGYELSMRAKALQTIFLHLPGIKVDLSNFEKCLYREMTRIKSQLSDKAEQIKDFYLNPAVGITWESLMKQWVWDLLIQGSFSSIKTLPNQFGSLGELRPLPGGTVLPIRNKYVTEAMNAYIQMSSSMEEIQIFRPDEIIFTEYMPNSATAYGLKPIDALINLVTEFLLFEMTSKDKMDGNIPPEKLIVFGDKNPGFDDADPLSDPIDKEEQRRIENKLNRPIKNKAIATLTGYGTPVAVDISKADVYPSLMQRAGEQIPKFVAMAFNASQNAVNDNPNGLGSGSAAETNERKDVNSGIRPLFVNVKTTINTQDMPFRFGTNYIMDFKTELSELETVELATAKWNSEMFKRNEIRASMGLTPDFENGETFKSQTPEQAGNEMLGQIQESLKKNDY